jgi:hypothetical protein
MQLKERRAVMENQLDSGRKPEEIIQVISPESVQHPMSAS